jgi:peptidoglycan/LPS O-acetylase OafA/YrhL
MAMSAIWPDWYGVHQVAFEAAVKDGAAFTPDTTILVMNIIRAAIVSLICGYLAALIARENRRSPLILGVLLVAFDLVIVAMSKGVVPLWYLAALTIVLLPMAVVGGRMKTLA